MYAVISPEGLGSSRWQALRTGITRARAFLRHGREQCARGTTHRANQRRQSRSAEDHRFSPMGRCMAVAVGAHGPLARDRPVLCDWCELGGRQAAASRWDDRNESVSCWARSRGPRDFVDGSPDASRAAFVGLIRGGGLPAIALHQCRVEPAPDAARCRRCAAGRAVPGAPRAAWR